MYGKSFKKELKTLVKFNEVIAVVPRHKLFKNFLLSIIPECTVNTENSNFFRLLKKKGKYVIFLEKNYKFAPRKKNKKNILLWLKKILIDRNPT